MSQRNVDDDEATELLQKELLHVRNQHGEALIIIDRYKPVIEAAKALHFENMFSEDGYISHDVQLRFRLAVEALQEVESD